MTAIIRDFQRKNKLPDSPNPRFNQTTIYCAGQASHFPIERKDGAPVRRSRLS
jgi:hypothetical protein